MQLPLPHLPRLPSLHLSALAPLAPPGPPSLRELHLECKLDADDECLPSDDDPPPPDSEWTFSMTNKLHKSTWTAGPSSTSPPAPPSGSTSSGSASSPHPLLLAPQPRLPQWPLECQARFLPRPVEPPFRLGSTHDAARLYPACLHVNSLHGTALADIPGVHVLLRLRSETTTSCLDNLHGTAIADILMHVLLTRWAWHDGAHLPCHPSTEPDAGWYLAARALSKGGVLPGQHGSAALDRFDGVLWGARVVAMDEVLATLGNLHHNDNTSCCRLVTSTVRP